MVSSSGTAVGIVYRGMFTAYQERLVWGLMGGKRSLTEIPLRLPCSCSFCIAWRGGDLTCFRFCIQKLVVGTAGSVIASRERRASLSEPKIV